MSTKSTVFLTEDNEHCYYEHTSQKYDKDGQFLGWDIEMEISKKNVDVYEDEDSIVITFKPGTDIYKYIKKMDIESGMK